MKTVLSDRVSRAALIMIALGVWSLFLLQIRAQPHDAPAKAADATPPGPRYQLTSQGDAKMYLVDTYTGRTWGALGSTSLSSDEFTEVTPVTLHLNNP